MLVGEVLGVIRDLADEGATMVIVTHEMEFARQVANQVIFMSEGQIAEAGAPEAFFAAPKSEKAQQFLARFHQHLESRSAAAPESSMS
jgi:polar amino acid transport system ATP-binding protein